MINWLDFVLLVLIFYSAGMGWKRGLVRQFFDIVGIFAAYFLALRYGTVFISWLDRYLPLTRWLPQWFTNPLPGGFNLGDVLVRLAGFIILFLVVRALVRVMAGVLHGIFSLPLLGTINGLGGLVLGTVKGLLLTVIIVAIFNLLSTPFWQQTIEGSVVATSILYWLPIVYKQMLDILLFDLLPTV